MEGKIPADEAKSARFARQRKLCAGVLVKRRQQAQHYYSVMIAGVF